MPAMQQERRHRLLSQPSVLADHVADVLFPQTAQAHDELRRHGTSWTASAVLFLLHDPPSCAPEEGPSLVLNKRSLNVPQPGDLCCPGGGISRRWDPLIARALDTRYVSPGLQPLRRWSHLDLLERSDPNRRAIALLLATALREGFEEMRLLPLGVSFVGLLPTQRLRLLRRAIHPVVARLDRPQRFRTNWEVDSVVSIPLRFLLDPTRYARYRVRFEDNPKANERMREDFICFRHEHDGKTEILWGATYRITATFLESVFDFTPPPPASLPLVHATLDAAYLTGQKR